MYSFKGEGGGGILAHGFFLQFLSITTGTILKE